MVYAQVIVKRRTHVQELTYALSAKIIPYVKVGSLVEVPLKQRNVAGVVVSFSRHAPKELKGKIREISKLSKQSWVFSPEQITVTRRLAEYYAAPLAEVAFHSLDQPQLWAEKASQRSLQPLVISGPWPARKEAYRQISAKSQSKVLIIFAQRSFLEDFLDSLPEELQRASATLTSTDSQRKIAELTSRPQIKTFLGTLGEVFFPLSSGDTIIVDQPSHVGARSQLRPFLRSERVAIIRSEVEKLNLVLGETVVSPSQLLAVKQKRWRLRSVKFVRRPLTILDRRGSRGHFLPATFEAIDQAVKKGERSLVLVLARGFASSLICRDCGYAFSCDSCGRTTSVVADELRCRYCGNISTRPAICPVCQSPNLQPVGEGVSAIRDLLVRRYPSTGVVEVSSDQPIYQPKAQVTVATEKIFSYPSASFDQTFVVSADRLVSAADIDGPWRLLGFLLELQAATQHLTVQTFFPDSLIWSAAAGRLNSFFATDFKNRRQLHLPPYGAVIGVVGVASHPDKLLTQANALTEELLRLLPAADISKAEIDDRSGSSYRGHFNIYLPTPPPSSLKQKLAATLPPSWHLYLD